MTLALEDGSRRDYQARRKNVTIYDACRLNLNAIRGASGARELAPDHHHSSNQFAINLRLFAEDQYTVGRDSSANRRIDPKRSRRNEVAMKPNSLLEKTGPIFSVSGPPL